MASIPKILHFIWIGDKVMPTEFCDNISSWLRLHPMWRAMIWDDKMVTNLKMVRPDRYHSAQVIVRKSDVLRYEILNSLGGVYVDVDVECLKPIDELIAVSKTGLICGWECPRYLCTAVMASSPGHPSIRKLIDNLPQSYNEKYSTDETGPIYLTNQIANDDVTLLEPVAFYPYHWLEKHRRDEDFPNSYCVHHWAHTWKDQLDMP